MKKPRKPCLNCGKPLPPKKTRFCCIKCYADYRYRADKTCECGEFFTTAVYVMQMSAEGCLRPERLDVCESCKQLILEDDPSARAEPWSDEEKKRFSNDPREWTITEVRRKSLSLR
jgi:hypothetical protein